MKSCRFTLIHLLAAMLLTLGGCAETIEASYATAAEAQSAGAMAKGWVPDWLPASATDIREAHNLDTNKFMLRFSLPKSTDLLLPEVCKPVALNVPPDPPFRRAWWPSDVPASGLATHRHAFYGCNRYFVAYSGTQGEGFVWRAE